MSSTEVIRMDILCADYDYGKSILLWSIPHEYIREYSIQLSVVSWINYVYKWKIYCVLIEWINMAVGVKEHYQGSVAGGKETWRRQGQSCRTKLYWWCKIVLIRMPGFLKSWPWHPRHRRTNLVCIWWFSFGCFDFWTPGRGVFDIVVDALLPKYNCRFDAYKCCTSGMLYSPFLLNNKTSLKLG